MRIHKGHVYTNKEGTKVKIVKYHDNGKSLYYWDMDGIGSTRNGKCTTIKDGSKDLIIKNEFITFKKEETTLTRKETKHKEEDNKNDKEIISKWLENIGVRFSYKNGWFKINKFSYMGTDPMPKNMKLIVKNLYLASSPAWKNIISKGTYIKCDNANIACDYISDDLVLEVKEDAILNIRKISKNVIINVGETVRFYNLEEIPEIFNVKAKNYLFPMVSKIPKVFSLEANDLLLGGVLTLSKSFSPKIHGNLFLDSVRKIYKGFDLKVGGKLSLKSLKYTPYDFHPTAKDLNLDKVEYLYPKFNPHIIGGSLWLNSILEVNNNFQVQKIDGSLFLNSVIKIRKNFYIKVGGSLSLHSLPHIPDGFHPDARIISFVEARDAGKDFCPKGHDLYAKDLLRLGEGSDLSGITNEICLGVIYLPDNIKINPAHSLSLNNLLEIPKNSCIKAKNIYLQSLEEVPEWIGDSFQDCSTLDLYNVKQIHKNCKIRANNIGLNKLKYISDNVEIITEHTLQLSNLETIGDNCSIITQTLSNIYCTNLVSIGDNFTAKAKEIHCPKLDISAQKKLDLFGLEIEVHSFTPCENSDLHIVCFNFNCYSCASLNIIKKIKNFYGHFNCYQNANEILFTKGIQSMGKDKTCFSIKNEKYILIDGILGEVKKKHSRGDVVVYQLEPLEKDENIFVVTDHMNFAHGRTIEEAKTDLLYKISSDRDPSEFKKWTLNTKMTLKQAIDSYRIITGACATGTRMFVEHLSEIPKELTVKEAIKLTEGQYQSEVYKNFFTKKS